MSTLTIKLDDDAVRLVEKAAQAAAQPLEHWLRESICQAAALAIHGPKPITRRISPLHPGAMAPSADFNAPLEEFGPHV